MWSHGWSQNVARGSFMRSFHIHRCSFIYGRRDLNKAVISFSNDQAVEKKKFYLLRQIFCTLYGGKGYGRIKVVLCGERWNKATCVVIIRFLFHQMLLFFKILVFYSLKYCDTFIHKCPKETCFSFLRTCNTPKIVTTPFRKSQLYRII